MISMTVLPWICFGSGSAGFPRNLKIATSNAPSTSTKTTVAKATVRKNSPSTSDEKSPFGVSVDCG